MPARRTPLYLHEEVMLLALRDEEGKKRLQGRKKRIERLTSGGLMGKATREAVQAAQAAVMVACMVPAITVTAVAH